jgi:hypothetical protein
MLEQKEIENRFGFHKASIEGEDASKALHGRLRTSFKSFAAYLNEELKGGGPREAALAMTHLEEASMWAHKAIAYRDPIENESDTINTMDTVNHLRERSESDPELAVKLHELGLD